MRIKFANIVSVFTHFMYLLQGSADPVSTNMDKNNKNELDDVISMPFDTVESYIYSNISYMQDDDPNNMLVELEEVYSSVEQGAGEIIASREVLNDSIVLEEYPGSHDAPYFSQHTSQSIDVDNLKVDETGSAFTSTLESSALQNERSWSNTSNAILPVRKNATRLTSRPKKVSFRKFFVFFFCRIHCKICS